MEPLKNYDPKQVTLIFGAHIVTGFTSGTFIDIGYTNPVVTMTPGINAPSRALSSDSTGTCIVTLDQTSASNDVFSAAVIADKSTGTGVYPLTLKDGSGRTINFAESAWIGTSARQVYSNEILQREWTIEIADLDMFSGGNPTV